MTVRSCVPNVGLPAKFPQNDPSMHSITSTSREGSRFGRVGFSEGRGEAMPNTASASPSKKMLDDAGKALGLSGKARNR